MPSQVNSSPSIKSSPSPTRSAPAKTPSVAKTSSPTPTKTTTKTNDSTKFSSEVGSPESRLSKAYMSAISSNFSPTSSTTDTGPKASDAPQVEKVERAAKKLQEGELERPVILVHGLKSNPEAMKSLSDHLAANGLNKDGGVVTPENLDKIDPEGKIFRVQYSDPSGVGKGEQNTQELRDAIKAIQERTGAESVDIVAHSRGGRDSRQAMEDKNVKVNQLVTLGTPHQGARFADLTSKTFSRLDPEARNAVEELRSGSKRSQDLNRRRTDHVNAAKVTALRGTGVSTPGSRDGDGIVGTDEARLKGARNVEAKNCDHLEITDDPAVHRYVANTLTGQKTADSLTCETSMSDAYTRFKMSVADNLASETGQSVLNGGMDGLSYMGKQFASLSNSISEAWNGKPISGPTPEQNWQNVVTARNRVKELSTEVAALQGSRLASNF